MIGVSIGLWQASIVRFLASSKSYYESKRKLSRQFFTFYASLMGYLMNTNQYLSSKYSFYTFNILVFINLILLCGDIEENRKLKTKPNHNLSVCPWNVKSVPSHIFRKLQSSELLLQRINLT